MIPFGEYLPDHPAFQNPGATLANGCLPLTQKSYGPLGSLAPTSDPLPATPMGAAGLRAYDGNVNTFVGTADRLYRLSGLTWVDVSGGAYTTSTEDTWKFVTYGDRVICVNGLTDKPQALLMGSETVFSDLAAEAPSARHLAVIGNFVMVGNTFDAQSGAVPNRVHWSAIDDPTNWPEPGTQAAAQVQSDFQNIPTGGSVQGIVGAVGGADGAIFMERSIHRVSYVGGSLVFQINEVERDRGTPAPGSIVNVSDMAFYLGEDGFYAFDGTRSTPIGAQKVDKTFFNELDQNYFDRITAAADPINKVVFFAYPGAGNSNGTPNRLLIYNWEVGRWTTADVTSSLIFRDLTPGFALEELDQFGTLDELPYSLDSRVWTGGRLALSAFGPDRRLARFAGSSMAADIMTTEFGGFQLFRKPNERMYINGVRPYVDGGDVTVSLIYRDSVRGATSTDGPSVVDPNGMAHFDRSCRYAHAQVSIAAGGDWAHAQGIDLDAEEDGEI